MEKGKLKVGRRKEGREWREKGKRKAERKRR